MKPHEAKAMLDAYQKQEVGYKTGSVTSEFQAGFEAALAMKKKTKWASFEEWFHHSAMSKFTTSLEEIWEEARK